MPAPVFSHPDTLAVHAGRAPDPTTGAVVPSPVLATTFARDTDGQLVGGFIYNRTANPNRQAVEAALTALEGGVDALAFASGQAASVALLQTLQPGDRVLFPNDLYHGTRVLARENFARWDLQVEFHDFTDLVAVAAALSRPAALVWIETPSNPQLHLTDIAAVAKLARAAGALVAVDNTWSTPLLTRPLQLGAHVVLHSTTKYLGGHSDLLGGALVLAPDVPGEVARRLRQWQNIGGAVPSPFDCWLLLRSLATLGVRVRQQCATAQTLAQWLSQHPRVERVCYPGLPTHPGYSIARQQMSHPGAMLSMLVAGGAEGARTVAGRCRLFIRATSLGGVESLIEHRRPVEPPDSLTPPNLLRVSIGLEHVDDLRADLAQALS